MVIKNENLTSIDNINEIDDIYTYKRHLLISIYLSSTISNAIKILKRILEFCEVLEYNTKL